MIYTMTRSLLCWKIQQAEQYQTDYITYDTDKIPLQTAQDILRDTTHFDTTEGFTSTTQFEIELKPNETKT
jgi:hypothetical protein